MTAYSMHQSVIPCQVPESWSIVSQLRLHSASLETHRASSVSNARRSDCSMGGRGMGLNVVDMGLPQTSYAHEGTWRVLMLHSAGKSLMRDQINHSRVIVDQP